ncbi:TetR/AcrR family transcriptional regulator [Aquamicrobium sp.]|uniref:TetR/AcrR family transcriptional regulator n=1 Tax=Aquamicrobium sp. TaxID=1872579 RepID=UPI00258D4376|nr:TetR/AcrR family transcriptional regulator [Aquamicrobium sp.]MCK9552650.1 TetR/AcrR family transcriptional regulator [Aquamicrobium sp.]
MAQVKKDEIKYAIVDSARNLFSVHGYQKTTISSIARQAKLSVGNIYAYFPSKLDLLYEIYGPWMQGWYENLELEVRSTREPTEKLRLLFKGLWHDFPASNPGLANSLMEALASSDARPRMPDDLLSWFEKRLARLLSEILSQSTVPTQEFKALAQMVMMTQDGYIINYRRGENRDIDEVVRAFSEALYLSSKAEVQNFHAIFTDSRSKAKF